MNSAMPMDTKKAISSASKDTSTVPNNSGSTSPQKLLALPPVKLDTVWLLAA